MAAGTIDSQILKYLPLLEEEEKKSLLSVIKTFLNLKKKEQAWRISVEDYNKELDEALERANSGNYHTQDEVEKQANKW